MNRTPDLFNDVLGPVMRGPSSSHTAASWRIAGVALQILNETLVHALIEFDETGAWHHNYIGQGTATGMNGGLLGLDIRDPGMTATDALLQARGIAVEYQVSRFGATHPNTVRMTLTGASGRIVTLLAVSTGGGAFRIERVNGHAVSITGDCHELLVVAPGDARLFETIQTILPGHCRLLESDGLYEIRSPAALEEDVIQRIQSQKPVKDVIPIRPVMPVIAGWGQPVPFDSISTMLDCGQRHGLTLARLGMLYEQKISNLPEEALFSRMADLLNVMDNAIRIGLAGTHFEDRILHQQAKRIKSAEARGVIPSGTLVNRVIASVSALMEAKSAYEVIVAAPTAGSCGVIGGVLHTLEGDLNVSGEERIHALFAAAMIGVWIADTVGFSAEEHACQVECGAASAMAAAAAVQLYGGTARQAVDAASMALQNQVGLICDPVADRVEVPCLGKNISAALNALGAATMVMAGFDAVIPLDQVLNTVRDVSALLPASLKCTGRAGLSVTPASRAIGKRLQSI